MLQVEVLGMLDVLVAQPQRPAHLRVIRQHHRCAESGDRRDVYEGSSDCLHPAQQPPLPTINSQEQEASFIFLKLNPMTNCPIDYICLN